MFPLNLSLRKLFMRTRKQSPEELAASAAKQKADEEVLRSEITRAAIEDISLEFATWELAQREAPRVFEVKGDYTRVSDKEMPVESLNPLQSCFLQKYRMDRHCVVESGTGTGKSLVAYIACRCYIDQGIRVVITAPTKEVVKGLYKDAVALWGSPVVGLKTSDDRTVADKLVIVTTPEGYLSAVRSGKEWSHAGLMIVDEAHNLTDSVRGGNLDVAMTVHIRNGGRVLLMSGTFPTKKELADFLKADLFISKYTVTKINKEEKDVRDDLDAKQAPKKLPEGVIPTITGYVYNRFSARLQVLKEVLAAHKDESVLVFVPTKGIGYCLSESLTTPMHSADLDAKDRDRIMAQFNSGRLKILIATSTLSQGVNTPCDVVVVFGTRCGGRYFDKNEVDQMFGRAGRGKPEAKVYIIGDKIELCRARDFLLTKSMRLPVESMVLTVLSADSAGQEDLVKALSSTYAASFTTRNKVEEAIARALEFLDKCHILCKRDDGRYSLTEEGVLLARYFIAPSDYIEYLRVARKLESCDFSDSSEFHADEFVGGLTIKGLCKSIFKDGYMLKGKPRQFSIAWLNEVLTDPELYSHLAEKKKQMKPSDRMAKRLAKFDATHDIEDLKRLNRALIEESYPQETPNSELDKGCILLSKIISVGNMPEFSERLIKDFQVKWAVIETTKEIPYANPKDVSVPQEKVKVQGKKPITTHEPHPAAAAQVARRSALLRYYTRKPSEIPPYFEFQLGGAGRFIGLLNDMEYYKIFPEAPGKKLLESAVNTLRLNLKKQDAKKQKKPAQLSLISESPYKAPSNN